MQFREKFRKYRLEKKIGLRKCAERLGIPTSTLSGIEHGYINPKEFVYQYFRHGLLEMFGTKLSNELLIDISELDFKPVKLPTDIQIVHATATDGHCCSYDELVKISHYINETHKEINEKNGL